jgi:hypothetical protein
MAVAADAVDHAAVGSGAGGSDEKSAPIISTVLGLKDWTNGVTVAARVVSSKATAVQRITLRTPMGAAHLTPPSGEVAPTTHWTAVVADGTAAITVYFLTDGKHSALGVAVLV